MARHPKCAIKNKLKKLQEQTKIIYLCNCLVYSCRTICFLARLFTFFVCLRFSFNIFNHQHSEGIKILNLKKQKSQQKHNFPNDNTRHGWIHKIIQFKSHENVRFFIKIRKIKRETCLRYKMLLIYLGTNKKKLFIPKIMKLRVKMQDKILSKLNEILSMLFVRSNLVNNVLFF